MEALTIFGQALVGITVPFVLVCVFLRVVGGFGMDDVRDCYEDILRKIANRPRQQLWSKERLRDVEVELGILTADPKPTHDPITRRYYDAYGEVRYAVRCDCEACSKPRA